MKITIPEELKQSVPQTQWGRILTATPVIMTIIATMLAGLASSEMTRAQYDRSLAAQQQSKAGDQWSYFQAKRMRSAFQRSTMDILQSVAAGRPFNARLFRDKIAGLGLSSERTNAAMAKAELLGLLDSAKGEEALALLEKGQPPNAPAAADLDQQVEAALQAIETTQPEPDITAVVAPIKTATVNVALRAAVARAQAFDALLTPLNRAIDDMDGLLSQIGEVPERDFTTARLRYAAARYDAESRLNQAIANLYELQVRQSNLSAERHHRRSQRFFFGMLAAQAGVIIATFSIAAQRRNLLWSLAAGAGLAAIGFAIYVYFYI
jgi:hypothetical protein